MALSSAVCARSSVSLKLEKKTSYQPVNRRFMNQARRNEAFRANREARGGEKIKAAVTSPLFLLFPRSLHKRRVPIV